MSRFLGQAAHYPFLGITYLILWTGLIGGCAKPTKSAPLPISQWLEVGLATKTVSIQIAHKNDEMAKGLMFRTSLGEDRGMLFFYHPPKQMSFWMRNTKIPLDIGYFTADGVLREIYPMYPMDERSVKSKRTDLLMALEMNQGWYAKNGVKVGDNFNLEQLRNALVARGVSETIIPF